MKTKIANELIVSGLKARNILNLSKIFKYFDEIHIVRNEDDEVIYDAIISNPDKLDVYYSPEEMKFLPPFAKISWNDGCGNRKHCTLPLECFDYIKIV